MALSGIAVTVLNGIAPGLLFRGAALLAILTWILVRIVGTVPINSATMDWNPENPPQNWRELLARTERFHIVGTWAALLAFVCFLLAMALRLTSTVR